MQNRIKESQAGRRLFPDSGAAHASWAKGLTMPMTDQIQIKPRDAERLFYASPYFSVRVTKIKTLAGRWRHQQEKRWIVPQTMRSARTCLKRVRHSNGSGSLGASRRQNNDDLHACAQPRARGCSQSAGRTLNPLTRWCYTDPHKNP